MKNSKVLFLNPTSRNMSLVPPVVPLFHSIFKANDIDMKYFDTAMYDVTDKYSNPDTYKQAIGWVKEYESKLQKKKEPLKSRIKILADFRREVEQWQPDVIMASAMESMVPFTLELLGSIRDLGVPHVLGGVFATFAPEIAIRFEEVDIICVGEGEKVIVPLTQNIVAGKSLSTVPNIWVKDTTGNITRAHLIPPVNLDDNPLFDASIFDDTRFYRAMAGKIYRMFPVETHRGCTHVCTFCCSPSQQKMYKTRTDVSYFRKKLIKNVMKDVNYFASDCKAEYLFFWADNFLSYTNNEIDEFCEAYSDYRIPYYIQSYPANLSEYKMKKLKDVGLNRLGLGIEHGNEEFRRNVISRNYSNKAAIKGTQMLRQYDIQYSCNNIVGFPMETPELHIDTVKLMRKLEPHTASCSIFTPFRGTPLRELAISKGYLKDEPNIYAPSNTETSILDMPDFTKEQISGKSRTFNFYVKFPESRWDDIKKAEAMTPEGNRIWAELKKEYIQIDENLD